MSELIERLRELCRDYSHTSDCEFDTWMCTCLMGDVEKIVEEYDSEWDGDEYAG